MQLSERAKMARALQTWGLVPRAVKRAIFAQWISDDRRVVFEEGRENAKFTCFLKNCVLVSVCLRHSPSVGL
jgi:hypothetical protein